MSGGSWDYAYFKVLNSADTLAESNPEMAGHPLRAALRSHMEALSEVMRDIEWSDSGDTDRDEWEAPVRQFLEDCSVQVEPYPDSETLAAARDRLTLHKYLESVGVPLVSAVDLYGRERHESACINPEHGPRSGVRMTVYLDGDYFTCGRCHQSGGAMRAIQMVEGLTAEEAFNRFVELAGAEVERQPVVSGGYGPTTTVEPLAAAVSSEPSSRLCGMPTARGDACQRRIRTDCTCPFHG